MYLTFYKKILGQNFKYPPFEHRLWPSLVLPNFSGFQLLSHPHTKWFLWGAILKNPPMLHRFPSWNLHTVFSALIRLPFEPIQEIPLKWLRLKTIFLAALTSARRISELGALSVRSDLYIFHKDTVTLWPFTQGQFHRTQEICLLLFCPCPKHSKEILWYKLGIHTTLKAFLIRMETIPKSKVCFINIAHPKLGQKMSKAAVIRLLKICIVKAYRILKKEVPPCNMDQSLCSASTMVALINHTPWSSLSTFVKYCKLNFCKSAEEALSRRVLQHIMTTGEVDPPY